MNREDARGTKTFIPDVTFAFFASSRFAFST